MTTTINSQPWNTIDQYRAIDATPADRSHTERDGFANGTNRTQPGTDRFAAAPSYVAPQATQPAVRYQPGYAATITDDQPVRTGRRVDQGRYWVGAVLTSGVAALAGVIGIVVAQDLLRVPLSMASIGLDGAHMATYGLLAALVALLAAGAYDGMLAFAPRPTVYYSWITGLLVALAVLLPFTAPVAIASQVALALINLVVGISIMVLVPIAASNARVR